MCREEVVVYVQLLPRGWAFFWLDQPPTEHLLHEITWIMTTLVASLCMMGFVGIASWKNVNLVSWKDYGMVCRLEWWSGGSSYVELYRICHWTQNQEHVPKKSGKGTLTSQKCIKMHLYQSKMYYYQRLNNSSFKNLSFYNRFKRICSIAGFLTPLSKTTILTDLNLN